MLSLLLINRLSTILRINVALLSGWKHIGKVLGLLCLCGLFLIGCGRSGDQRGSPSPTTAGSNRITLGTTAKIRTLDPADAYEIFAGNVLYNLGDRLYTYELGTTNLKPQLATELPKISSDGLVYTIPLRQGVVFHDGTPFNAKAMAFSLERFIKNGGRPAFLLADTIESIEPAGDNELTIRLKKPFTPFPSLLAFSGACAVSPKAYQVGSGKFQPTTFIGTGPYKLAQFGSDSVRLDAFNQYWGDKPANQGIDIRTFTSGANLFNAFRTKAVDVAYQSLDSNQTKTLKQGGERGNWQVIAGPGNVVSYLALNVKAQPLDNTAVRQAVAAMMNRPLLQQRVFQGQADPLYSLIPTVFDVNKPVFKDQYGDGNAAVIQALLSKAGYSPAKPLKLNLWYRSNVPSDAPVATTLKAFAQRELGGAVQIELSSVESATAYQNRSKGIYPIFLSDWYGDFFDPDGYIQPFLACAEGSVTAGCKEGGSQSQGSFYYSDRVNQLIDQERQEQNPAKRKQIFAEIQDILAEDVPFVPLWQNEDYAFAQQGINGVRLEPTQQFIFAPMKKL
jgi:peptide/nickel transport system substrate-binding protein